MKFGASLLAAAVALNVQAASAAVITFSHTTLSVTAAAADTFQLSSFDTKLGTLTGVSLAFNGTANAIIDIINFTSSAQPYTNASTSIQLSVTGPDASKASQTLSAASASGTAAPPAFTVTTINGLSTSVSLTDTILASNFGAYESVGGVKKTFSLGFGAAASGGTARNSGALGFGGDAFAIGTTAIIYTYTPAVVTTPEPVSVVLISMGIAGLAAVRRRR